LREKDICKIKIDSVAFGGAGIGRVNNIVVFVPFSAPGDELEVEILHLKKKFARGKISRIIRQSPVRVKPPCDYYEKCGGCCYQHLDYDCQLKLKKKQVEDAFWKIGKIEDAHVLDTIASPEIYHYRGKAQFHAGALGDGWEIGFQDVSGGQLVDIDTCRIMHESINKKMSALRDHDRSKWTKRAKRTLNIWSDHDSGQIGDQESIVRTVKGKDFLVPRDGFFQANLFLTGRLVDEVNRLVASEKVNTLIDAYCGSGLFSVFMSPYVKQITGIEINEKSVKYARMNAEKAGIKNAVFLNGDVDKILQERFVMSGEKADMVVLDPPRAGCAKPVLDSIVNIQPRSIIYISCNPATQARDVQYLKNFGYNLKSLLPVDMFPQTEHIEVVGHLEWK
jgi:23S rRNA (uracil1939-C5)-methyltransferase